MHPSTDDLAAWWPLPEQEGLRDRLIAAYADPSRSYHDVRHLAEVLAEVDALADARTDRDAVLLAAWFHDAVYDGPGAEERSAALAETELAAAGLPDRLVAEVARLVRLTLDHRPADDDLEGQVLCDADLAILAAPEQRYAAYVAGVRREYADLDDVTFRRGRAAVLRDLAAKHSLFHTAAAQAKWETSARGNLARELADLDR